MHKVRPFQMDASWTIHHWPKRRAFFSLYRSSGRLSSRRDDTAGRFFGMHGSEHILWIHQSNDRVINWPASSTCLLFVMNTASTN